MTTVPARPATTAARAAATCDPVLAETPEPDRAAAREVLSESIGDRTSRSSPVRTTLACILLALVVVGFFFPQMHRGRCLVGDEGLAYYLPMRELVADAWRGGRWPGWDPSVFAGRPLMADPHAAALYPPNLLFLILPPVVALNVVTVSSHVIAAWGMVFLLRLIGVRTWSAALGALVYVFSTLMVSHIGDVSLHNAAGWLPWLCWVALKWARDPRPRWIGVGGVLWAVQYLAGDPQVSLYSVVIVALMSLSLVAARRYQTWYPRYWVGLVGMIALAAALSAIQIWPTLELGRSCDVSVAGDADLFSRYPLPPLCTPLLWVPQLFGAQSANPFAPAWWGPGRFSDLPGYVGLLPWLLLPLACSRSARRWQGRSWAAAGFAALLLAWCVDARLIRDAPGLIGYVASRTPGTHLLGLVLALAICTGIGIEALRRMGGRNRRRIARRAAVVGGVGMVVLAAGVVWGYEYALLFLRDRHGVINVVPQAGPALVSPFVLAVPAGAGALSAAVLVWYARRRGALAGVVLTAVLAGDVGWAAYLDGWRWQETAVRQMIEPPADFEVMLARPSPQEPPPRFLQLGSGGPGDAIIPRGGASSRFASLNGYGPFQLRWVRDVMGWGAAGNGWGRGDSHWAELLMKSAHLGLDLCACRYVVVHAEDAARILPEMGDPDRFRSGPQVGSWRVFENLRARPRAWFVDDSFVLSGARDVLAVIRTGRLPETLKSRSFDPAAVVVVESGDEAALGPVAIPGEDVSVLASGERKITWLRYEANRLALEVQTGRAGVLVLAEPYAPGWRATLDGEAVEIARVDHCLRAVRIPAGTHELEMIYRPESLPRAAIISGAGMLAAILLLTFGGRQARAEKRG